MDVVGVSEMAGADAANGGRLLIEVTDEGEAADESDAGPPPPPPGMRPLLLFSPLILLKL